MPSRKKPESSPEATSSATRSTDSETPSDDTLPERMQMAYNRALLVLAANIRRRRKAGLPEEGAFQPKG